MMDITALDSRNPRIIKAAFAAFLVFVMLGVWQLISFSLSPADDFYQPQGYIRRVNTLIQEGKVYAKLEKTRDGYRTLIHTANLKPEDEMFYEKSWLKADVDAFNEGNADVFLLDRGRLQAVNVYRHRIESPLASDWRWWGRVYSQSAEGYAYLWNSRRTLKLFRPPGDDRATAKPAQTDFREVVYGRGNFFQTGLGISLKGRSGNRIADLYSLADSIVLKSYATGCCFLNGHPLPRGVEQRLEEGDLVQISFERNGREEFLFHDFSQKPLSFVNVENGRLKRTHLDRSSLIQDLADGIETAVRKSRPEEKQQFDVHLALDEDLSGLAQNSLESFTRQLSTRKARASCTVMDALTGQVLSVASVDKKADEINGNLRLHPVGSATKIFLAAAAGQEAPDLLDLRIDPHPVGEETNLLGYKLTEGYKLRDHQTGESGYTDFPTYIAKSCNRYHAILMTLALARDSAAAKKPDPSQLQHGIVFTSDPVDQTNGGAYLGTDRILNRPDLSYFLSAAPSGRLECNNLENSELALNLERLFDVKRKYVEGSGELFDPQPWNLLLARLGVAQSPELYPAFYPIMPQRSNLGFNLNIDFRQDFISLIFGGATNRWSNVQLAEAISRLVTDRKVHMQFMQKITDHGREQSESTQIQPLGLDPGVHKLLLQGMESVSLPGGTAWDLYPVLQDLKSRAADGNSMEFYAKTGTPFRGEIRRGEPEVYSSVFLVTALLRDRSGALRDGLTFAVYIEDLGEHKAVDFLKLLLPRILAARGWV